MNTSIFLSSILWLIVLGVIVWPFLSVAKTQTLQKYKTCPSCFEKIKQDADICGFCGKAQKKEEDEQKVHGEKMKTLKSMDSQELSKLNI